MTHNVDSIPYWFFMFLSALTLAMNKLSFPNVSFWEASLQFHKPNVLLVVPSLQQILQNSLIGYEEAHSALTLTSIRCSRSLLVFPLFLTL